MYQINEPKFSSGDVQAGSQKQRRRQEVDIGKTVEDTSNDTEGQIYAASGRACISSEAVDV
jgi:hypothetical protein